MAAIKSNDELWEDGWCPNCQAPRLPGCKRQRLIPAYSNDNEYSYGCAPQPKAPAQPIIRGVAVAETGVNPMERTYGNCNGRECGNLDMIDAMESNVHFLESEIAALKQQLAETEKHAPVGEEFDWAKGGTAASFSTTNTYDGLAKAYEDRGQELAKYQKDAESQKETIDKIQPTVTLTSARQLLREARSWVACSQSCHYRGKCICGAEALLKEMDAYLDGR